MYHAPAKLTVNRSYKNRNRKGGPMIATKISAPNGSPMTTLYSINSFMCQNNYSYCHCHCHFRMHIILNSSLGTHTLEVFPYDTIDNVKNKLKVIPLLVYLIN